MADFIAGETPSVDLSPFSPARSLSLLTSP
jgi:hypothetical protein